MINKKKTKAKMRKSEQKIGNKGQMQIQFNWVYVALVGVIILAIFINIASGIKKSSKTQLEIDAINYFDEIFTSVKASENTESNISLPGMELEIRADKDDCNSYTIKGSSLGGRSTEFTSLFSPHIIKKRVLSYSLGWDMPFRVNYFLYLTSPDFAFVSLGKSNLDLPGHLTFEEVDNSEDYINQNYYQIRFFSFSKDPGRMYLDSSLANLDNDKVTALYIKKNDHTIVFYEKNIDSFEKTGETYFFDEPSLIAALYSENIGSYECNIMKAVKRLNKISEILKQRVELIKKSKRMPICLSSYYDEASGLLDELIRASKMQKLTKSSVEEIISIRDRLKSLNTKINKRSCPTIY